MTTLVIADHNNKALNDATAKTVTAASKLGGDVVVLVAGQGCDAVAEAAAKLDGVKKVLVADDALYAHPVAEPLAALVVGLAKDYDAIVTAATTVGKNFMPRVAALLDVAQISEITAVDAPDTFQRPIYAGNAIQTVKSTDAKKVITVRTTAFPAAGQGGSASVEKIGAAKSGSGSAKKTGDVLLRYNFPAAGLSDDALRTLVMMVLATGADVRRALVV